LHRYNFVVAVDPQTKETVPLFNPRSAVWAEHFTWSADGLRIVGVSAVGRATCQRLDLNDAFHDDGFIQKSRALWAGVGWHPPKDDPRELA
jgi:hypothetical protein